MKLEDLKERQKEIDARLNQLNADSSGEAFTDEATAEWDNLHAEAESNDHLIEELETREAQLLERSKKTGALERTDRPFNIGSRKSDADIFNLVAVRHESSSREDEIHRLRDNAKMAIDRASFPQAGIRKEDAQAHIERLLDTHSDDEISRRILETGSPLYARAFSKTLAGKQLSTEERAAMSTSGAAGGFAVPLFLDPTVIPTTSGAVNPWRQIARVVTITGANTWEGVSSAGVTATRTSEAVEVADASPTFAQPSGTVTKVQSLVQYSVEIEGDWAALQGELATMFAQAKDREEAGAFATATGTAPNPVGILGAQGLTTAAAVNSITTAAFAVGDVYNLESALPAAYQPNASVVGHRAVYNAIRQFDTAGGAQLFMPNLQAGLPTNQRSGDLRQTLLGYPTYESTSMASTPATSAAKTLLLGDFANGFVIVDRVGMQVELVPHMLATANNLPTLQRGLIAWWRNTSVLTNAAAFRYLVIK